MWLEVVLRDQDTDASVGHARVGIIRVAEAMNHGVRVHDGLERAGGDLRALADVFFDPAANCLKEAYHNGVGWNAIYFEHVTMAAPWAERNLEEATVKRVVEVWGEGSAIAVMTVVDASAVARWHRLGFEVVSAPDDGQVGFACLDLSRPLPSVDIG